MNWFDFVRGRYNIGDRWIGLDYSRHFLDPKQAYLTLIHETVHSVLAMQTDFGQATGIIFQVLEDFQHFTDAEREQVAHLLYFAQDFVQEGFATFMQVAMLRRRADKYTVQEWIQQNLPSTYQEKLNRLAFMFDVGNTYREYFTAKVSHLVMETGFRRDCPVHDLLRSPQNLARHLADPDHSPNERLEKVMATLRYKEWLVSKSPQEIAKQCGITYIEPSTKEEVAQYLSYITSLTSRPVQYTANDIGETPHGVDAINQASHNLIVGNMNLNLVETGIPILNPNEFLHYADVIEAFVVSFFDKAWKDRDLVRLMSGREPDLGVVGFTKTGEKYLTSMSVEEAPSFLNGKLAHATMIVKWGAYDITTDRMIWSQEARPPDVVLYNTVSDLSSVVHKAAKLVSIENLSYLHAGVAEKHPIQTVFFKAGRKHAIHCVNTFGNRQIVALLAKLRGKSKVFTGDDLLTDKKHLNDTLAVWMGLPWHIDWIETMLDGKDIHYR